MTVRSLNIPEHLGIGGCGVKHAAQDQDCAEDHAFHGRLHIRKTIANMGRGYPGDRFDGPQLQIGQEAPRVSLNRARKKRPRGRFF
jgi:hypothetical protein